MYTLRKIIDNRQINLNLGNNYSLIEREVNPEEFNMAYKVCFGIFHVADLDPGSDITSKNCYGFISSEGGKELHPLYKDQFNYIMTENGKTFSNLTYK